MIRRARRPPAGVSTAVGSSRMRMSAFAVERLQDLDALLLPDRDVLDRARRVDAEAEALGELAHALGAARLCRACTAGCAARRPRTMFSATVIIVDELEVLVHHPDAERDRIVRVPDARLFPLYAGSARVGLVEAEEDVHEGRLAGAVLAEERVDLAAPDVERRRRRWRRRPGTTLVIPSSSIA